MFELTLLAIGSFLIGHGTNALIGWGVFLVACVIAPNDRNIRTMIGQLTSTQESLDKSKRSKSNP
jgi:hypothetical protein